MSTDSNERMYNILVEMIPFMKDIKSAMNYQNFNLTSLNNSIWQMNARLDQTEAKLSELQNSLNVSLSSLIEQLNTMIDKSSLTGQCYNNCDTGSDKMCQI